MRGTVLQMLCSRQGRGARREPFGGLFAAWNRPRLATFAILGGVMFTLACSGASADAEAETEGIVDASLDSAGIGFGETAEGLGSEETFDTLPESDGDALDERCEGVLCSGHGDCVVVAELASCECDDNFTDGGELSCIDRKLVDCIGEPPHDAVTTSTQVEIRYTDNGGWTEPDTCPWNCDPGFIRVDDVCVPPAALTEWCTDYCRSLDLSCGVPEEITEKCTPYCESTPAVTPDCVQTCLAGIDEPGAVARTVCEGLPRRIDSVGCNGTEHCSDPFPGAPCTQLCDAAAGCDLLRDVGLTFGSSHGECFLACHALSTALTPQERFEPFADCVLSAFETCDAVHMLACTMIDYPKVRSSLCTVYDDDCGAIPEAWPDLAACEAAVDAWTPQQCLAVSGCITFFNSGSSCIENDCIHPPSALPPGLYDAVDGMMSHCPEVAVLPGSYDFVVEFYAWTMVAVLRSMGAPIEQDFGAVLACITGAPCPEGGLGFFHCLVADVEERR
jgi:hypothetical protein